MLFNKTTTLKLVRNLKREYKESGINLIIDTEDINKVAGCISLIHINPYRIIYSKYFKKYLRGC